MTVRRSKHRVGPFEHETLNVDVSRGAKAGDLSALKELFSAATPAGRIAKWMAHAERLGVALDELVEAGELIDDAGKVAPEKWDRFQLIMERACLLIERAQNEETFVPSAVRAQKFTGNRRGEGITKKVLMEIYNECGGLKNQELWKKIKEMEKARHPLVQEIEGNRIDGYIVWFRGKKDPVTQKTIFNRWRDLKNEHCKK